MAVANENEEYKGCEHELDGLFVGKVIEDANEKEAEEEKERKGRDVVSMFEDKLQRDNGAFDEMIEKEEEDAEGNKGSLSREKKTIANYEAHEKNGGQGGPGT